MNFSDLQAAVKEWSLANFGADVPPYQPLLGAVEEIGELAHAQLKGEQGIRGTAEEHCEAAKDAVADTIIYLTDYCWRRGFDLQGIVESTWQGVVSKRDWRKNPLNGEQPA